MTRLDTTPGGVRLCALQAIPDGAARNFVLQLRAGRFHGFVVRRGVLVFGYVDRCPHMGLPLAQRLDEYLSPDGKVIACSWHGAMFDVPTGACVGGPCPGSSLTPWPVAVVAGQVVTAFPPPVSKVLCSFQEKKAFFSEERKQKTLVIFWRALWKHHASPQADRHWRAR